MKGRITDIEFNGRYPTITVEIEVPQFELSRENRFNPDYKQTDEYNLHRKEQEKIINQVRLGTINIEYIKEE